MPFDPIEDVIEEIRKGNMVVIVDDEDRENEGDIIMAAEAVTPDHINFMAQYARGLICMPMSREKAKQLSLAPMVPHNQSAFRTNFTASIEAATGVTTGISAADRARTIQIASNPQARPEDIVQPGHVFPIVASPGGVLVRAGHTEASIDLARLAGFGEVGVLVEIMNADGTMARRDDLLQFVEKHGLKISSIADLIRYRLKKESTVSRVYEASVQIFGAEFKAISFFDNIHQVMHLALVHGEVFPDQPMPIRVQGRMNLCDLPGLKHEHGCWTTAEALHYILRRGGGALLMLDHMASETNLLDQLQQVVGQGQALPSPSWREIGIGSQILSQLGFHHLEVLGSPRKLHALSGFGLTIHRYVECELERQWEACCDEAV